MNKIDNAEVTAEFLTDVYKMISALKRYTLRKEDADLIKKIETQTEENFEQMECRITQALLDEKSSGDGNICKNCGVELEERTRVSDENGNRFCDRHCLDDWGYFDGLQ